MFLVEFLKVLPILIVFSIVVLAGFQFFYKQSIQPLEFCLSLLLFVFALLAIVFVETWHNIFVNFSCLFLLYFFIKNKKVNENSEALTCAEYQVQEAKQRERSRIYANIHDDVGSKLLELIYHAPDDNSKKIAKEILQTLRTSVASTENVQFNIQQLNEELIQDLKLQVESVGKNILISQYIDNPKQRLHINVPVAILRIFKEVVSNAIKHAKSETFNIDITSTNISLNIVFIDNGVGFSKNQNNEGKGFSTIRKRAGAINSKVKWSTLKDKGTRFELIYDYK